MFGSCYSRVSNNIILWKRDVKVHSSTGSMPTREETSECGEDTWHVHAQKQQEDGVWRMTLD